VGHRSVTKLAYIHRNSTAPVVIRDAAQNLQWIFKTMIALLQKYCYNADGTAFNTIEKLTSEILSIKGRKQAKRTQVASYFNLRNIQHRVGHVSSNGSCANKHFS
jgi:hypothetical protein